MGSFLSTLGLYETTFIIRQDMQPSEVSKVMHDIISLIEGAGGKLLKKESWGLRKLAYRIKKNVRGYYVMLTVEMGEGYVAELNRQYRIRKEDVIRFMTMRIHSFDPAPSLMMQSPSNADIR